MHGETATDSKWRDGMRALEEALWNSATQGNPEWMDLVLAPDFAEHGASGRVWTREEIIAMPIGDEIDVVLPLPDFAVRMVSETIALVTYTSIVAGIAANRMSLWRHDGTRWRLEFHQGTAAEAVPATQPPSASATAVDTDALRNATFGWQLEA